MQKLKRASFFHCNYARDGVVHIMKSDCGKSLKITQMSKPVELFPVFDFRDEE